jgi:DHA1 family multidrug resistance protein-like MFS transporter
MIKSYVIDAYSKYAASAFAANNMIRSGVAAAFPLFTTQMFRGVSQVTNRIKCFCAHMSKQSQMGINWAATLIAFFLLLLAAFPFIFYKYGPRIRSGSSFAPCMVSLEISS